MSIRRAVAVVLALVILCMPMTACGDKEDDGIKIVTTGFACCDWARQIAGENAKVEFLQDNGVDIHSYQPTVEDMATIAECDLFIWVGGESEAWVEDVLEQTESDGRRELCLFDILEDELICPEGDHHHDEGHNHQYDEHVWLSLGNAMLACDAIAKELCLIDEENKDTYTSNAEGYITVLEGLDGEYRKAVTGAKTKALVIADRHPFAYMARDYGLEVFAAFEGCSAESEASFETVARLAGKLNELELDSVMTIDGNRTSIAEAVITASGRDDISILVLNSLQTVKDSSIRYIDVMRSDLEVLKEALG